MTASRTCTVLWTVAAMICAGRAGLAADQYYAVPLAKIVVLEDWQEDAFSKNLHSRHWMRPPQGGEAYLADADDLELPRRGRSTITHPLTRMSGLFVVVRIPEGGADGGQLLVPGKERVTAHGVPLAAADRQPNSVSFALVKWNHFRSQWQADGAGAAWFRQQTELLEQAQGWDSSEPNRQGRFWTNRGIQGTYDLVSGGRALSENLQLQRTLRNAGDARAAASVPVESIAGITVREFDWGPLVAGKQPALDPLAKLIPADQHVLFLPSLQELSDLIAQLTDTGMPLLRLLEPVSENHYTLERYQRQLGLRLDSTARAVGPELIDSLAITGGDPYFVAGTDVAVIMHSPRPLELLEWIDAQVLTQLENRPDIQTIEDTLGKVSFRGQVTPDREISSFRAIIGDAVVVTNSTSQLERLVKVRTQAAASLAALPEYTFFRDRYRREDKRETALLMITDPTIRRWCSPRWRIGASRRLQAASVLCAHQAAHLTELLSDKAQRVKLPEQYYIPAGADVWLTPTGVYSPTYGTLKFQTPIGEMDITHVTPDERRMYDQWRRGYESNWSRAFDPIAVRLTLNDKELSADVTVLPLIRQSTYNPLIQLANGKTLQEGSGDPHAEALLHLTAAVDTDGPLAAMGAIVAAAGGFRVNPFSWVGDSAAVYMDPNAALKELAKRPLDELTRDASQIINQIPLAAHVEVKDGLKLTAFLVSLRMMAEQAAPGMIRWETKQHRGQDYAKVVVRADRETEGALFYAPSVHALDLSLNEEVLKRALDRRIARSPKQVTAATGDAQQAEQAASEGSSSDAAAKGAAKGAEQPAPLSRDGATLAVDVDREFVNLLNVLNRGLYQRELQQASFRNLAILNQWKLRFPDRDPVKVHQQVWHRELVCPGGGNYRWNEAWQTMESTVFGHPLAPKSDATLPPILNAYHRGEFRITFEHNGLRSQARLRRDPAYQGPAGQGEKITGVEGGQE